MNEKVWLFDVDGTLVISNRHDELHETAVVWLKQHKPQRVALCSNQGGVGLRYWMESGGFGDPDRYPTETAVRERMAGLVEQIRAITGGEVRVYLAFSYLSQKGNWSPTPEGEEDNPEWSREWRKPGTGMLLQAAHDYGVNTSECVFVGDMDTDQEAAEAAGVAYEDADALMSIDVTIHYPESWVADWLRPHDRIGLNIEKSFARFEQKLKRELDGWYRVGNVTCARMEGDGDDFVLSPGEATAVIHGESLAWSISQLFIHREWLVYETAVEHVEALYLTRWQVMNTGLLMDVYGISHEEAVRLVRYGG